MAQRSRQAAGTVAMAADVLPAAAARAHAWRAVTIAAFAVALMLVVTLLTLQWDGVATYDAGTPGAPRNAADAEQ